MNLLFRISRCSVSGGKKHIWNRGIYASQQPLAKSIHNTSNQSNQNLNEAIHKSDNNIEWRPIYKLPLVRLASAFNRLKVYQAILTTVTIPISYVLADLGEMPQQLPYVVASLGITGIISLSLCSLAFQNLVGLIYINKHGDSVKIAYVDFWGRRQHIVSSIDNLLPEWEQPKSLFSFYQPIRMQNNHKKTYKLIQRFGVIIENNTFSSIFGE